MDFNTKIKDFSKRIETLQHSLKTEEAVKTSLVLPFFQLLGYDVFNPYEFVPEYTADTGIKKGEKVDYCIMINNEPTILIEAKFLDKNLNKHINQLYRYFSVTKAKFAILTNGIVYKIYTDLDEPNKMDEVPFLEVNLLQLKDSSINQLKKFTKESFNIQDVIDSASELKYTAMVKNILAEQLKDPSDQFIKLILNKGIYNGTKTQAVLDKFKDIILIAFNQYIGDIVNDKIQIALDGSTTSVISHALQHSIPTVSTEPEIIEAAFSEDELRVLNGIKDMISEMAISENIIYKKTSNYIALQLGNNTRRWICRIYFKQNQPHTLQLHQIGEELYDCEYLFNESSQLHPIKSLFKKIIESI